MIEDYLNMRKLGEIDVDVLIQKGQSYGSSWRNRGGVGAFMMLARKWDRIENLCKSQGYDIFKSIQADGVLNGAEGVLDDIQDLRRYLLLVESYCTASVETQKTAQQVADNIEFKLNTAFGSLEGRGETRYGGGTD
jgi:hypothetical protein